MKFIEIFQIKESDFFDRNRVIKRSMVRRAGAVWIWSGLGILLVALLAAAVIYLRPIIQKPTEEMIVTGSMNIIESVESAEGMLSSLPEKAVLKIKTREDVSAEEMNARLALEPEAEYKIKRTGACKYQLSFTSLARDTLYNLRAVYQGQTVDSWALQRKVPFSIVSVSHEGIINKLDSPIEITFSHANVTGFEEGFSIFPKVEGRFEHHGRTWGFVPSQPLAEGTLYTVTIDGSVGSSDAASLEEDYSFSFRTAFGSTYAYLIAGGDCLIDSFLTNEPPIAAIGWAGIDVSLAKVQIYSLTDDKALKDAYKKYVHCGMISPEIIDLAQSAQYQFEAKPILAEDYGSIKNAAFIQYPEALPKGYYFAQIEIGGRNLYQLLQITDLSVYHLTAGGDYIVWVNRAKESAPVADASISLDGFSAAKTSASGVAVLKGANPVDGYRFLSVNGGDLPYLSVLPESMQESKTDDRYFTYITVDTPFCKGGDTIEIYGAILPKSSQIKMPSSVILKGEFFEEEIVLVVDKNGVFSTELTLPKETATDQMVSLYVENICLDQISIPLVGESLRYKSAVSVDKKAYLAGEAVQFKGQITYADGSPAAGVKVTDDTAFEGVTDKNGQVIGTIVAKASNQLENAASVQKISLKVADAKEQTSFENCYFLVMPSPYILESEYKDGVLNLGVFDVNFEGAAQLDTDALYLENYDLNLLKGGITEVPLYAELHEVAYVKAKEGVTYNPRSQRLEEQYSYSSYDRLLEGFQVNTSNGLGRIKLPLSASNEKNYYVDIFLGEDNSQILRRIYLIDQRYASEYNRNHNYNLVAADTNCSIGEEIGFFVRQGSDNAIIDSGSVLYTVVSGGVLDVFVSSSARFALTFKEEYAPDVLVYGAYFDGIHCHSIGGEYLRYDQEQSQLSIKMATDKVEYGLGDKINLTFNVRDAQGEPAEATLLVYFMDRSLYKRGCIKNPLAHIYASRCIDAQGVAASSYRDFNGKTGMSYKLVDEAIVPWNPVDYVDNAVFEIVNIAPNGEGAVALTMPQNYADWKVIACAINADGCAGINAFDLCPGKGLYTSVVLPESFEYGSDCPLTLKAEIAEVDTEEICEYQVRLSDANGNEIFNTRAQGISGHYSTLKLGVLPVGEYTAYIDSRIANFKERVIKIFSVKERVDSSLISEFRSGEISHSFRLDTEDKAVLAVIDQSRALWSDCLGRLGENSGERIDAVLARNLFNGFYLKGNNAKDTLNSENLAEYFEQGAKWNKEDQAADLKLTALLSAVAPQSCDQETFKVFFYQYLNNRYASKSDMFMAYIGLASFGDPILEEILYHYEDIGSCTQEEALYLALAFAYAGDYQTAKAIYMQHLKPALIMGNEIYYAIEGVPNLDATELIAILASKISLDEAEGLLRYCMERCNGQSYLNFIYITYLFDYVDENTETRGITISADGKSEEYDFPKGLPFIYEIMGAGDIRISSDDTEYQVVYGYYG